MSIWAEVANSVLLLVVFTTIARLAATIAVLNAERVFRSGPLLPVALCHRLRRGLEGYDMTHIDPNNLKSSP